MRNLSIGFAFLAAACGSSSSPEPIDPVAVAYCAECSDLANCETVVNETLNGSCPEENRAWYSCATDNACDDTACAAEWAERDLCQGTAPVDRVRRTIFLFRPSVNLGHRGTGPTREGRPFPENSISAFLAAMDEGADGVELDLEITKDGRLIIMHDDTLDRTTNCSGCVSEMTFDEIRACRLVDGDGMVTDQRPPTLVEAYTAVGGTGLVNVELKVFGSECQTDTTGPEELVAAALDAVTLIGGEGRTIFSSFDETAAGLVKTTRPDYYSALISLESRPEDVEAAVALNQDAIHPSLIVTADTVQAALDADLQVNVWVPNSAELMEAQIDKGSTGILTDNPAILADLLDR